MVCCVCVCSSSVASNSLAPHGPQTTRLLYLFQARILEWVATPFSRGSSQLRDPIHISCIAGRFFTSATPREATGSQHIPNSYRHAVWIWLCPPENPPHTREATKTRETEFTSVASEKNQRQRLKCRAIHQGELYLYSKKNYFKCLVLREWKLEDTDIKSKSLLKL